MFLATVSALLTLAFVPFGSPTVEDSSDDRTVVVDRQVLLEDDGGEQIIRIGDGDDPMIIGIGGRRGFIGVRLIEISDDLRKHYGASADAGVLVSEVEADSPAAKAGIQVGDIITQADGDRVDSTWDLSRAVREKKTGDKVRLQVLRDRRTQDVTVTLEEREGHEGRIRGFRSPRGKRGATGWIPSTGSRWSSTTSTSCRSCRTVSGTWKRDCKSSKSDFPRGSRGKSCTGPVEASPPRGRFFSNRRKRSSG